MEIVSELAISFKINLHMIKVSPYKGSSHLESSVQILWKNIFKCTTKGIKKPKGSNIEADNLNTDYLFSGRDNAK